MKTYRTLAAIALVIFLSSCTPGQPTRTFLPGPSQTPTQYIATSDPATPSPPWLTLTHDLGVSIHYPASWKAESTPNGSVLLSPDGRRISWETHARPLAERLTADPTTWVPNEGGYDIYWSRPVSIEGAEGLEFIWGPYHNGSWGVAPELIAILYSDEHELDIRLTTFFDGDAVAYLAAEGPEATISKHFRDFEEILASVAIEPN